MLTDSFIAVKKMNAKCLCLSFPRCPVWHLWICGMESELMRHVYFEIDIRRINTYFSATFFASLLIRPGEINKSRDAFRQEIARVWLWQRKNKDKCDQWWMCVCQVSWSEPLNEVCQLSEETWPNRHILVLKPCSFQWGQKLIEVNGRKSHGWKERKRRIWVRADFL